VPSQVPPRPMSPHSRSTAPHRRSAGESFRSPRRTSRAPRRPQTSAAPGEDATAVTSSPRSWRKSDARPAPAPRPSTGPDVTSSMSSRSDRPQSSWARKNCSGCIAGTMVPSSTSSSGRATSPPSRWSRRAAPHASPSACPTGSPSGRSNSALAAGCDGRRHPFSAEGDPLGTRGRALGVACRFCGGCLDLALVDEVRRRRLRDARCRRRRAARETGLARMVAADGSAGFCPQSRASASER